MIMDLRKIPADKKVTVRIITEYSGPADAVAGQLEVRWLRLDKEMHGVTMREVGNEIHLHEETDKCMEQ